ncbi:hypothetical protein PEPS_31780 (plasmid) [Persicobacter psychrovividus]|uniref:Damage-inducible protein DinB n=2 Tax=Persicobacter psychrovividus TaxID=387638 RepID=A0ABM7VJD3_9BACT|nr:hypothetical protein PEPS_31780 [Persicobacter psychrovividus]
MRHLKSTFFMLCLVLCCGIQGQAQYYSEDFSGQWQRSKAYTLAMLDSLAKDELDYRPTAEVMSLREEFNHLMNNFGFLQYYVTGEKANELTDYLRNNPPKSKQELREALIYAFDYVGSLAEKYSDEQMQQAVPFFKEEVQMHRLGVFLLMRNHVTHHRGRISLMLRMLGHQPPKYVGW